MQGRTLTPAAWRGIDSAGIENPGNRAPESTFLTLAAAQCTAGHHRPLFWASLPITLCSPCRHCGRLAWTYGRRIPFPFLCLPPPSPLGQLPEGGPYLLLRYGGPYLLISLIKELGLFKLFSQNSQLSMCHSFLFHKTMVGPIEPKSGSWTV